MSSRLAAIRAVYFDAVGTLIHPDPPAPQVYGAIGKKYGSRLPVAEIARRFREAFGEEEAKDRQANWVTSEARNRALASNRHTHTVRNSQSGRVL